MTRWTSAALVALAGCSVFGGIDADDYRLGMDASGADGSGADGSGAGTTTTAASGAAGHGAGSGGGNHVEHEGLDGAGLVVRYFLDEEDSGQAPEALDAGSPPQDHLALTFTGHLTYVEQDGQRGLQWDSVGESDRAAVLLDGTKIHAGLDGSTTGTMELVFSVEYASAYGSRVLHIGEGTEAGSFSLTLEGTDNAITLRLNGDVHGRWYVSGSWDTRRVFHLVFDSSRSEDDRVKLYLNGALQENEGPAPGLKEAISLSEDAHFVLGNREEGERSFEGTLFYAAVYRVALSQATISEHSARLLDSDDTDL
jgi:hypothetical protein